MSHQSAESRVSINRLRCRLRNHNPTIQATATTPSPAPTMTPVETQSLVAPDVHSFTAHSAVANTIIPIATLIPERAFYISLMNMIIGPTRVHSYRNRGCYDRLPNNTGPSDICCSGVCFYHGRGSFTGIQQVRTIDPSPITD